jgi:hypothetical protein
VLRTSGQTLKASHASSLRPHILVVQVLRTSGQTLKASHASSLRPHILVLQVLRTSVIGEGGGKRAAEAA